MSILKSTKTGYKYFKWKEDAKWFAERALQLSYPFRSKKPIREVRYTIPKRHYRAEYASFADGESEEWFKFDANWSVEEFLSRFIQEVESKLDKDLFELQDVTIPSGHIIES